MPLDPNRPPEAEGLAQQIVAHWRQFCPTLYGELQRAGRLQAEAKLLADETRRHAEALQQVGMSQDEAWGTAMRDVALVDYDHLP